MNMNTISTPHIIEYLAYTADLVMCDLTASSLATTPSSFYNWDLESCEMENGSNDSNSTDSMEGLGSPAVLQVFGILLLSMGGVAFLLSVPTIIALCAARTVAKVLRIFLVNLLVTGLLTNSLAIISILIVLITVFSGATPPPPLLCRFFLWLYNITSLVRSYSVVGFSIMVLIVVKHGKNMRLIYIILSLCLVWGLSLLLTIQYQVPQVYAVAVVAGAVCLPVLDGTLILEARISFTALHLIITALLPLAVCIVVPLIVLCYSKKHSATGSSDYGKAAAKLGLFMVAGSLINSVGIIVSGILGYVSARADVIIYIGYIIIVFSLYPTPILTITFLKPVRDKLKMLLKCKCVPSCPSAPSATVRNRHQLQEHVYDSLIVQQYD